ncbi:hypothetical protein CNMCM8057_008288 [Aspergillus fumigatus]|nr:hypothetical protein CNMCM8057_008288 [Aspergillus fumigatus]
MAQLYENNAMQKHSQYYPTTPILSDEGTEKTRIPHAGSPANLPPAESDVTHGRKRSKEPEDSGEPRGDGSAPSNGEQPIRSFLAKPAKRRKPFLLLSGPTPSQRPGTSVITSSPRPPPSPASPTARSPSIPTSR